MSHCGRQCPLPAQQQTGEQGSANGKYLGDTGRSWGKWL
jgi:hypothetical protein